MHKDKMNRPIHPIHNVHRADKRVIPQPPKQGSIRGAFHLRTARYPWPKAISAALTMGLSLLIGGLLGHMEWGLLTTMGGFTALYVHDEPYFQRAVKLALVAVGLAASFGVGTLLAGTVWTMAVALGVVSAVATFVCSAWKVPTPSAYFFILACAVGTGLPVDPAAAPLRAGLALGGGAIAWCISMAGWLVNAHGPETSAVARAYRALAEFLSTIGTVENDAARHNATIALRAAEDAVMAGELRWRTTKDAHRLFLLTEQANALFLAGIALSVEEAPISPALAATVRALADTVSDPDRAESLTVPHPTVMTPPREKLFRILRETVHLSQHLPDGENNEIRIVRPNALQVLKSALSKQSLALPATLRIGIAVAAATFIAAALGNHRPYWVPLTVACVLQGATVLATVQRTVQRAIGTSLGVLLGGVIFMLNPGLGWMIAVVMALQLFIELIIVRNYAIAVIFITPIPLMLAELGKSGMTPEQLVWARLLDTWLGCVLGLCAALVLWHRASSVRVKTALSNTIRRSGELLTTAVRNTTESTDDLGEQRRNLLAALSNLRMVHDSALNEFPRRTEQEVLWPAVVASSRIGYLALAVSEHRRHESVSAEECQRLMDTFEQLAHAASVGDETEVVVHEMPHYPNIYIELCALQESLIKTHNGKGNGW